MKEAPIFFKLALSKNEYYLINLNEVINIQYVDGYATFLFTKGLPLGIHIEIDVMDELALALVPTKRQSHQRNLQES